MKPRKRFSLRDRARAWIDTAVLYSMVVVALAVLIFIALLWSTSP